jgi:sn-glycerol 3-phosphate transport system permease protein
VIKKRRLSVAFSHILLVLGILIMIFPVYLAFVAASYPQQALLQAPLPLLPGRVLVHNLVTILMQGISAINGIPLWVMLLNSCFMAAMIAVGKILVSIISAYALVFFQFPFRRLFFWLIFFTLMLPVEVRILPTFQVTAGLGMLNHWSGLTLPLIASATATFLFRQFFLTIPNQLWDAARIDGAGGWRFFVDVIVPLSRTNIAALFTIMFIYGWNQYLWPLVITTDGHKMTIVMGIQQLAAVADQIPQWNYIMATALLAMLPPVLIVVLMQHWFEKGLLESEK